jgi:hypothetical protein
MRKTGTWLVGVVLGLSVGLATSLLVNRPEVRADDKKPKWEYKVAGFQGTTEEIAKQISKLANEGWEYVGLINTSVVTIRGQIYPSSVAFKRPKK